MDQVLSSGQTVSKSLLVARTRRPFASSVIATGARFLHGPTSVITLSGRNASVVLAFYCGEVAELISQRLPTFKVLPRFSVMVAGVQSLLGSDTQVQGCQMFLPNALTVQATSNGQAMASLFRQHLGVSVCRLLSTAGQVVLLSLG
jgi:hypothetical protein